MEYVIGFQFMCIAVLIGCVLWTVYYYYFQSRKPHHWTSISCGQNDEGGYDIAISYWIDGSMHPDRLVRIVKTPEA